MEEKTPSYYKIDNGSLGKYITNGIRELLKSTKNKKKKKKLTKYDKYNMPIVNSSVPETTLIPIDPRIKYNRFLSNDHKLKGKQVANAGGMSSSISGDASGGTPGDGGGGDTGAGIGFGVGEFGVSGFGESYNKSKEKFISHINDYHNFDSESTDILEKVISGYKILFDNIETKTTCVLMGIQPSLSAYIYNLDELAVAINTFGGEILSVYIGSSNGLESEDVIKEWYIDIGVHKDIVDKIVFIEKSTPKISYTSFALEFNSGGQINTLDDVDELVDLFENTILVRCFDLYFSFDFMFSLSKKSRRYEIDKRFAFLVEE